MAFSIEGLTPITSTKKNNTPTELWEEHLPLIPSESHIMHTDFSVRTIASLFKFQTLEYKITVFQMKTGFFNRNHGVKAIEVIANMVAFLNSRLEQTGLNKVFGIDYSLFEQKYHSQVEESDGKKTSLYLKGYKNVEFYIMPLVPIQQEDGVVHRPRLFSRALAEDRIKLVQTQQTQKTQKTQQPSGWGSVAQPQPQPQPQATLPESWEAK